MASDPLARPEEAIRRLYGYVSYRIGPGAGADDVVSETIERALKYRSSYDAGLGSPAAWLTGIARRCIADHLEGRKREELAGLDAPEGFADELATRGALRVDLARALAALDDRGRELIALRYGADLASKEIGPILGLKPGSVDVAIHRTLARLRAALEQPAIDTREHAAGEGQIPVGG